MAATTSQWWCRLVNAYRVKAGMVYLHGKSCMIHTWVLSTSGVRFSQLDTIQIFIPLPFNRYCS